MANPISHIPYPTSFIQHYTFPLILFLLLLTLVSLLLSFGLNEEALGPNLVPLLEASPYRWLYDNVAIFQGIRVPGRFGILVVIGLVGLAGWGAAALLRTTHYALRVTQLTLTIALTALILLESWSVPLVGPEIPAGPQLAPVYRWLQTETSPDTVVLELPFQGPSEFLYEYYSSHHWRRLANGGTGFTPPVYREMRQWFKTFPDARSVDVIQQLGIDHIILHAAAYEAEAWQRLLADLPRYLPAFTQVHQFGDDLVLQVAEPLCQSQADQVKATFTPTTGPDGLSNAVQITYHNPGLAAFVADVGQVSYLTFEGRNNKNFTEPLVTPAGETQSILAPLPNQQPAASLTGAWLATLNRTVSTNEQTLEVAASSEIVEISTLPEGEQWQALGLNFSGGPQLVAYHLSPQTPTACSQLTLALKWAGGQADDKVTLQLLDPFGRVVIEQEAQPEFEPEQEIVDIRMLPLVGSLPAGRYGLRVQVHSADGQERLPVTEAGVTIPTDQIPPLPLVIHPAPVTLLERVKANQALIGQAIRLQGSQLQQTEVAAGDWLRFTLIWQAEQPLETDLTVFTQLLGPDGQVWGQQDNQPKGGWYSTSLWLPSQPVTDDYAFQIDPAAPVGEYQLIAGMYNNATLQRLPVQTAAGSGGDFVEIGTVRVNQPISQQVAQ
jgi:hypothetical protein